MITDMRNRKLYKVHFCKNWRSCDSDAVREKLEERPVDSISVRIFATSIEDAIETAWNAVTLQKDLYEIQDVVSSSSSIRGVNVHDDF